MSYGYHRLRPGTSAEDYVARVASHQNVVIAIAVSHSGIFQGNEVIDNTPYIPGDDQSMPEMSTSMLLEPPKVSETLTVSENKAEKIAIARSQGYTGDICINCHGIRLKQSGHCAVCEDCGTTTGCS